MSDTLDWVCGELGVSRELFLSRRREKPIATKRRIIFLFFRLMGKSTVWMQMFLKRDHTTMCVAINKSTDDEKARACELVKKYNANILGKDISELKVDNIRRKIKIKVPNYHTGAIEEREVFTDEYQPKQGKLPEIKNGLSGEWNK